MPRTTSFKGMPLELAGPELKVGDPAPDFDAVDKSLQPISLESTSGVRVFSVVPSLDTPVCDMQTKKFNDEAGKLPNIGFYTISVDLPFAQNRWCNSFGVDNVKMISDHKFASFGENYGTLIKDWRVESRAIFVIDKDNKIQHVEYVPEVAEHPDYDTALAKAKELAG
ncbi:thiol peroxidase [Paludibaculum fermentans]|uniref:Thiol peroxidase n=1 Tax=Paludibaculum fermentans TaxID=1473598 RepID=A0A7S7NS18_PALFE|nr:thiol peroxidase [Paludibaculum fermentans]QOY88737.1 thiol peroxidase [Paludibaculum fermentans]